MAARRVKEQPIGPSELQLAKLITYSAVMQKKIPKRNGISAIHDLNAYRPKDAEARRQIERQVIEG